MRKRQIVSLCDSCDSPLRMDSSFCPNCERPTGWASHEERIQWEVRQWRASRAGQGEASATMMLVRTEAGYEPLPVRPGDQYVWDQPLHPEREVKPAAPPRRPEPHTTRPRSTNGNGNGHAPLAPARQEAAPAAAGEAVAPVHEAVVETPEHEAPIETPSVPEAAAPTAGIDATPVDEAPSRETPVAEERREAPTESPEAHEPIEEREVGVSKLAVAVGIVLALGLPLSGKVLDLSSGDREGSKVAGPATAPAAGPARPVALTATRSGFTQLSQDAARYAVVMRNPNRGLSARGVSVAVSMYDRSGRLIGSTIERLGTVAAGAGVAVAGQMGVAGRVSDLRARISVSSFETGAARTFAVRRTRMSRSGGAIVVRASVSASNAVRDARVVVVYVGPRGRVVGGDFVYVNVPSSPKTAPIVVSTANVPSNVTSVQVYVVAPA